MAASQSGAIKHISMSLDVIVKLTHNLDNVQHPNNPTALHARWIRDSEMNDLGVWILGRGFP